MIFAKRLREGVRRGEITCSVRIWLYPHVKPGHRYRMDEGEIEVESILPSAGGTKGPWWVAKALTLGVLSLYLGAGLLASYRAYFPVGSVQIRLLGSALRPGSELQVETVTSGRGPVSIQVECVQGTRAELLGADRIPPKPWAFWDPRRVYRSTRVRFEPPPAFRNGEVVIRATVTGVPAWLRQPPPVVEEASFRYDLPEVPGARGALE